MIKEKENEQSNMIIKMSFKQHIKKEKKKKRIQFLHLLLALLSKQI